MNKEQLIATLAKITGHVQAADQKEETALKELQSTVAASLINQHVSALPAQKFIFENSDIFAGRKIPEQRLRSIEEIASKVVEETPQTDMQVFVRDTPVRTTQLSNSINPIAAGARADKTVGPLRQIDGRELYLDFIRIERLVPLYIQGQSYPAVLFKASFIRGGYLPGSTPLEAALNYSVVPVSVWINARLLNPSSPEGYYCGLRVKSGRISLDVLPQLADGKLTVSAITNVIVILQLDQKAVTDADESSPYGADARNALVSLPQTFSFNFNGNGRTITEVAPSSFTVYGQNASFTYVHDQTTIFNPALNKLAIPVQCDLQSFSVSRCLSPFLHISGVSGIKNSWWAMPAAAIDINAPFEADGNGTLILECGTGLNAAWIHLGDKSISLGNPFILVEPGRLAITDLQSDGRGIVRHFGLWKDEMNLYGTEAELKYLRNAPFIFNSVATGDEVLTIYADSDLKIDRPVKVNGEPVAVRSKSTIASFIVSKYKKSLTLADNDILWDNKLPAEKIPSVKPVALALHNALFTVTPPNGMFLFSNWDEGFQSVLNGNLYLSFGLYSYLPTLPDPYAANIGVLGSQFRSVLSRVKNTTVSRVWLWLVSQTQWGKEASKPDSVRVSFHFAPLAGTLNISTEKVQEDITAANTPLSYPTMFQSQAAVTNASLQPETLMAVRDTNELIKNYLNGMISEDFALLDVSSKANMMGIAYSSNLTLQRKWSVIRGANEATAELLPVQVNGMDIVTPGYKARAFTLPQIAWEPVFNFTSPGISGDPPLGWNYYPDDGFPARIGNFSEKPVTLSPVPMSKYLVQTYRDKEDNKTYAFFNLPFGMLAFAILDHDSTQAQKANIENISPVFEKYINGGIQIELASGTSFKDGDDNMFEGFTIQLINVLNTEGQNAFSSTLGSSVVRIFNSEFFNPPVPDKSRPGVPLSRIGLSGYGANLFSDWHNSKAAFAETSQALFNVICGRTSHEVIQVKSVIYPWGIHVVRTITLFRLANGYVGRADSGWKAESNGEYDFSYYGKIDRGDHIDLVKKENPYTIHPGIVKGLYNIKNIKENDLTHSDQTTLAPGELTFNEGTNKQEEYTGAAKLVPADFQGLTFDADVKLENVVEGGTADLVPAKGIMGFVQLAPRGFPVEAKVFRSLLQSQNNSVGGPVNCTIKIAGTSQYMKLNRVDVNNSVAADNASPVFAATARGSVILPKDGSWSIVMHTCKDGEVTPLPDTYSVPLIREGVLGLNQEEAAKRLARIAHPMDLLRSPGADTVNFGFLQNLNSQKVLYLSPSFKDGIDSLLSKIPPLLADAYRLLNSKGIFPNIGDAQTNFGTAISLIAGKDGEGAAVQAFGKIALPEGELLEILEIKAKEQAGKLLDQGYKLIKQKGDDLLNEAFKFDLPAFAYPLIDVKGLKIFIEYEATANPKKNPQYYPGRYDFNVDSFAGDLADTWKGRMNNLAMVVNLGPLERIMTIKGNFNAQKDKETDFGSKQGADDTALPLPEIEFSKAVEPVIQILEILSELSTGQYADALKKGLKVAMSNSAEIWEYKFEAVKEIPLVRFPPGPLYDAPQTPLKLEASMGIGVYFNAALKVTTDPKHLLPTAGAFLRLHAGLQVMCVSVGAGTIYAVGDADLTLSADTSKVSLDMKFGFGAQIAVGLPVIGNVSILFMVAVEIYADSSETVIVTAILLFRGHAEILGGIVGVTITIEAKGSIKKSGDDAPTVCMAQVTFALDISIFLVIDISFSESWEEQRQIA